jgi:5-methylcytosine-specific restriction protein A
MYNLHKRYTIAEMVDYIDYLNNEKGIRSPSMIEFLLQLNNGEYTKLKDVLYDNDVDIVTPMMDGTLTIEQAFKKLEQRRRKESKETQEIQKTTKVYEDVKESGADTIVGTGEEADASTALTDEEIKAITITAEALNNMGDVSLSDVIEEGKNIEGFADHKQSVHNREFIDPLIKETVLRRDNYECQCCGFGGPSMKSVLDFHHVLPVFLGGADTVDNGITLCLNCHNLTHEHSYGRLHILNVKDMDTELQEQFKRIVKLGNVIREGMAKRGMKVQEAKKEHPIHGVGRRMPGAQQKSFG